MPDAFVSLRDWLARGVEPCFSIAHEDIEPEPEPLQWNTAVVESDIEAAIGEAKRFRAALADALSACVEELMRDIAGDVLARELQLAACDIRAIAERAIDRYGGPVSIHANPADAPSLKGFGMLVEADEKLRSGDVVLVMRSGSIDASLGVRLERVLAKYAS